jgi:hypothetical protein
MRTKKLTDKINAGKTAVWEKLKAPGRRAAHLTFPASIENSVFRRASWLSYFKSDQRFLGVG